MKKSLLKFLILCLSLVAVSCGGDDSETTPSDNDLSASPVEVMVANPQVVTETIEAAGVVRALYDADVSAQTTGELAEILADAGTEVEKGDVILALDDRTQQLDFKRSRAQLDLAAASYEKASLDLARMEELFASNDISESEIEQARLLETRSKSELELAEAAFGLAEKALQDTRISAPFRGMVNSVIPDIGEMVAPGPPVLSIVQIDTVEIGIELSAADMMDITRGQDAWILITSLPDEVFKGVVYTVSPKANEMTRTYRVEIRSANPSHRLKPGMLADITLSVGKVEDVFLVPMDAVLKRNGTIAVFVEKDGIAVFRPVTVHSERGADAIISSGIDPGDNVVIVGQKGLNDGENIRVTN